MATRRANASTSLRYGFEELKFVKSPKDVRIFVQKLSYKLPTLGKGLMAGGAGAVPPSVQIEPTNLCNLRCITCPGWRTTFPRGYMDMDLFERIVRDAASAGVKRIHLYLRGEPTLHPKIFEMIAFIKANGLALHLTTNGTTLTPERSRQLLLSGVNSADQLTISFIGHSKESHERNMPGVDHDAVVSNIVGLVRLRKELHVNGPVIETILNAPPETRHEEQDFLKFWRGKVDHARLGDIAIEFQDYGTDAVEVVRRREPCNAIYERLLVAWDGQVPQCNGDVDCKCSLGDMNTSTITELWNCGQLRDLRRIHEAREFEKAPMCLHCDM